MPLLETVNNAAEKPEASRRFFWK